MEYRLDITESFESNLDTAVGYIAVNLNNLPAAERLAANVRKAISRIAENPLLYPLYHDEKLAGKGYRYTVVANYLIFYIIDETDKIIHIAHFLYGGQNISDIL